MSYKTTKTDFDTFKKECEKWIAYFGLMDWEIHIERADLVEMRAGCLSDYSGKQCFLMLANEWDDGEPRKGEIKFVAFHEVAELLISPLHAMALSRFANNDEIDFHRHSLIRVLENTIFKEHTK